MSQTVPKRISLGLSCALVGILAAATGCDSNEPEPDESRAAQAPVQTVVLDLALAPDTDPERIKEVAKAAEEIAGPSVQGAKVQLRQKGEGASVLQIEMWGPGLEDSDALIAKLRDRFPELVDTPISVDHADGAPEGHDGVIEAIMEESDSPEEAKAAILKKLKEQGIDGDVEVEIRDVDGEQHVEVRVKKEVEDDGKGEVAAPEL